MSVLLPSFAATRRVTLLMDGVVYDEWMRVEITRDLEDIAGSFSLEVRDSVRSAASWPFASLASAARLVEIGLEAEIRIDGEAVIRGWVDEISPRASEGSVSVQVSGRDKTADLIDCAATLDGPSEYEGMTLDKIAEEILKPYGLKLRSEADVGKAFDRFSLDVGETALSAIEKGARQRGLLVTSDGMDSLVLTQSGRRRAAGELTFPGNVSESGATFSIKDRHSETRVKGLAERAGGRRRKTAKLDSRAEPLSGSVDSDWLDKQAAHESGGTTIEGKAKDAAMSRRYRPLVAMGRTQLTQEGAETQAEWMTRTARGRSEQLEYGLVDYRANGRLWRPNELVPVTDNFQQVFRDMLVAGVTFSHDEGGSATRLRLTGPEAYDMEPEGNRRANRKGAKSGGKGSGKPLDSTAHELTRS